MDLFCSHIMFKNEYIHFNILSLFLLSKSELTYLNQLATTVTKCLIVIFQL